MCIYLYIRVRKSPETTKNRLKLLTLGLDHSNKLLLIIGASQISTPKLPQERLGLISEWIQHQILRQLTNSWPDGEKDKRR